MAEQGCAQSENRTAGAQNHGVGESTPTCMRTSMRSRVLTSAFLAAVMIVVSSQSSRAGIPADPKKTLEHVRGGRICDGR